MTKAISQFTEKIYKKFMEKLRNDENIPDSLIDEIEKLLKNGELTSSEAISKAYENCERSHVKN